MLEKILLSQEQEMILQGRQRRICCVDKDLVEAYLVAIPDHFSSEAWGIMHR